VEQTNLLKFKRKHIIPLTGTSFLSRRFLFGAPSFRRCTQGDAPP